MLREKRLTESKQIATDDHQREKPDITSPVGGKGMVTEIARLFGPKSIRKVPTTRVKRYVICVLQLIVGLIWGKLAYTDKAARLCRKRRALRHMTRVCSNLLGREAISSPLIACVCCFACLGEDGWKTRGRCLRGTGYFLSCDMASAALMAIGEAIKHLGNLEERTALEQNGGVSF